MKIIEGIFELATKKGLDNVSIRIIDNLTSVNLEYVLYVKEKDRMLAESLDELFQMLLNHKEDISWMNN